MAIKLTDRFPLEKYMFFWLVEIACHDPHFAIDAITPREGGNALFPMEPD